MRHYFRAIAVMAGNDLGGRTALKAPPCCQSLRTLSLDAPCRGRGGHPGGFPLTAGVRSRMA